MNNQSYTKKIILFDLDGTLLDTAPDILDAINLLLQRYQKTPVAMEKIRHLLTHGSRYFVEHFFGTDIDETKRQQLRNDFLDIYSSLTHQQTTLFPGMLKLLQTITDIPLPWGIVTNKLQRHAEENLQKISLPSQPSVLVCGDTLAVAKPDPAPLLHACRLAKVQPAEAIFIGDSDVDALTGKRAGVTTYILAHGYNSGIEQFNDLDIADWIEHPDRIELAKILT